MLPPMGSGMATVSVESSPLAPEIVWWTPPEAYLDDPLAFREHIDMWKEVAGDNLVSVHLGSQLDNPHTRVFVAVWKSLAHHQAFMQDEAYPDVGLSIMDAMVGTNKINQAFIEEIPQRLDKALSAPLTQFIYVTMRPWHDRGYELVPLIELLQAELARFPGCLSSCWGPSVEKEKLQIGIVGWTNLKARDAAVSGPLYEIIRRIRELSNVELRFSCLIRYTDHLF